MAKIFPTDTSAITPATGDLFLVADASDSMNVAELSFKNLFEMPPDNAVALGGASNNFTSAFFTDGTAKGSIAYSSNVLRIGSTSNHSVAILLNNATAWTFGAANLLPAAASSIGADSTTTALSACYFTDGTAKGVISFTSNKFYLKSTGAYAVNIYTGSSDGSDSTYAAMSGGGADANMARGAYVVVCGNENANTGQASLVAGNVAGGNVKLVTAAANTGVIMTTLDGAVADAALAASQAVFYMNEAGNVLTVKVKYAGGTVKTGTIALS